MTTLSRRTFVELAAATAAIGTSASVLAQTTKSSALTSLTGSAKPITPQERMTRLTKVQSLMQERKVGALLIEAGASLEYFTGIRWWRSERTTAVVIPAEGGVIIVTPFFEEPSVRETLQIPGEVRPWKEDASPFDLLTGVIRERAGAGPLAVEGTTRWHDGWGHHEQTRRGHDGARRYA
jgi:Xaa-Pro dipeptidase